MREILTQSGSPIPVLNNAVRKLVVPNFQERVLVDILRAQLLLAHCRDDRGRNVFEFHSAVERGGEK